MGETDTDAMDDQSHLWCELQGSTGICPAKAALKEVTRPSGHLSQKEHMKQYSGAVLFIDMLGIGALTRGKIPLSDAEYASWGVAAAEAGRHHILGAKLLMQFRRSLLHTKSSWETVKVAQLSDCAFLWSPDPVAVVNAAREIMWHATRAGLLCRAGLAYGQIVEPNKVNRSLGQFILGDAVTRAVGFEGSGKGARVFCDSELAHEVLKNCSFQHEPFAPLRNPLDGTVVDEFRWYTLPSAVEKRNYLAQPPLETALGLVELLTTLRYSPRLSWNSLSTEGRIQVACTVEAVSKMIPTYVRSDDYTFTVEHVMESQPKRSDEAQARIRKQFEQEISALIARDKKKVKVKR